MIFAPNVACETNRLKLIEDVGEIDNSGARLVTTWIIRDLNMAD